MSLVVVILPIVFIFSIVFLLRSLKRKSKSIIVFSYLIGVLAVASVVYVEWIAQPIPILAVEEEKQLAQENKLLIENINEDKVTNKQSEEALVQTLTVKPQEELYINDIMGNSTPLTIIKKSASAKETTVNLYALNNYFQGRQYTLPEYPKMIFNEEENSLSFEENFYLENDVYIISSSAFYLPYSNYAEGMNNTIAELENDSGLVMEVIVPENLKVHQAQ